LDNLPPNIEGIVSIVSKKIWMSNAASKGGFVKSWENKQKIQKMKDIIV